MSRPPKSPASIVITGASSGIGRALATRYSRAGVTLGLVGRNPSRLQAVAAECRGAGAAVETATLDVRQRGDVAEWLLAFDSRAPVSLVIANAGIAVGTDRNGIETPSASYELLETNLLGELNVIHPILPAMISRARGQIALMSSLSAFFPLTDLPSYSASKAALLSYGLALRQSLSAHGVAVSVICPGFVQTEMLRQQSGRKPFSVSADVAARLIARGLERDQPVIAFPLLFSWVARLGGLLPESIRRWTVPRFTVAMRDQPD